MFVVGFFDKCRFFEWVILLFGSFIWDFRFFFFGFGSLEVIVVVVIVVFWDNEELVCLGCLWVFVVVVCDDWWDIFGCLFGGKELWG